MEKDKAWFENGSKIAEDLQKLKLTASKSSVLDQKTKEIIKTVVASVVRCHHCTESHMKKALALGATKEELTEALLVGAVQVASTELSWDIDTFEKYLG